MNFNFDEILNNEDYKKGKEAAMSIFAAMKTIKSNLQQGGVNFSASDLYNFIATKMLLQNRPELSSEEMQNYVRDVCVRISREFDLADYILLKGIHEVLNKLD